MSDKLVELEQMVPQIGPALERRRIGESLGKAVEKLRDADRIIVRLQAILEIAKQINFDAESTQASVLHELLDEAEGLATDLENARSAEDLTSVAAMYSDFTKLLASVERLIRVHWRSIAEREFGPLVAIGKLLDNIGVASDLARRLRACGEMATGLRESLPADQLRDAIRDVLKTRSTLEGEQKSMTKKREVDLFLTALADGKATLRMVTDDVRDWLEQSGVLDRFGIKALS